MPDAEEEDREFFNVLLQLAEGSNPAEVEEEVEFEKSFIFFDFESWQSRRLGVDKRGDPIFAHDPNLCVVQKTCDLCKDDEEVWKQRKKSCTRCGRNRLTFEGENCCKEFAAWLFSPENKGCIALAHNSKGYDAQFLLKYLAEQGMNPRGILFAKKLVTNGTAIITLSSCGVTVKDSMCFLPMALASLPKAFNLTELKKGYFPYLFDTPENADYVGPWPDAHYYQMENKAPKEREAFLEWYEGQKEKVFDLRAEKEEYCESDVTILRQADMKFRDLFIRETGVDPLAQATTIASACSLVYRRNHLQPDTIGLVPPGGYRRYERHSQTAMKWLKWVAERENLDVRHAENGLEEKIGPYKVDGLCEKTVFEFNGCVYHGCPRCYRNRELRPPGGGTGTMEDRYQQTLDKQAELERRGYTVRTMWECELKRQLTADPEMAEFFKRTKARGPLDGRDAFFGGRTNPIWLYYKAEEGERIDYVDVCSLYPWVNKYGVYPMGHPKIITENFKPVTKDNQPYFGFLKLKVLPPKRLFHPVLPYRSPEGKLCFPLCRKCCDGQLNEEDCPHSDEERALEGTWVSLEVDKALEAGYVVQRVDEVWHYAQKKQYDGVDDDSGLFVGYINQFLKLKQQADGWPKNATTEEERREYLKKYEEREGIRLDPDEIAENRGLRSLAKLMLNSFWGKFGQRTNLKNSVLVTDLNKFYQLLTDETHNVDDVVLLTEEAVLMTVSPREKEFEETLPNTNIAIAAFTTAQARLKLYSYMEKLGERVLYTDTDSIIFVTRPGDEYEVPLGCFLGDMTDEVSKDYGGGARITEYVSTGPKSYAYKVQKADGGVACTTKSKGFTLDYRTGQVLNFEKMRAFVDAYVKEGRREKVEVDGKGIRRTKTHEIVTKNVPKTFTVTANKRKVMRGRFITYPYGY